MSRVNENQNKSAEAERMNQKLDKEARQKGADNKSRADFGQMVAQKGAKAQAEKGMQKGAENAQQEAQLGQTVAKQSMQELRTARMARGGVAHASRLMEQAKSFDGVLNKAQTETKEADQSRGSERKESLEGSESATTERGAELDEQRESRIDADRAAARQEAKDKGRVNSAIDGGGSKGGGSDQPADPGAQAKTVGAAAAAEGAKGAGKTTTIPEAILKALAEQIYVGVNAEGLAEFRIELKDGILDGATMRVTADDRGRIHLAFDGLEGHTRNLVKASEGDLARRLEAKGLRLESLTA